MKDRPARVPRGGRRRDGRVDHAPVGTARERRWGSLGSSRRRRVRGEEAWAGRDALRAFGDTRASGFTIRDLAAGRPALGLNEDGRDDSRETSDGKADSCASSPPGRTVGSTFASLFRAGSIVEVRKSAGSSRRRPTRSAELTWMALYRGPPRRRDVRPTGTAPSAAGNTWSSGTRGRLRGGACRDPGGRPGAVRRARQQSPSPCWPRSPPARPPLAGSRARPARRASRYRSSA